MPLETFPLFNSFPLEIQRLVWDLSARPVHGKRQVQFFIIVDHYTNAANPSYPIHGDFLRLGHEGRINEGFKLAVPYYEAIDAGNSSTYLLDSGLWMACRESRAAMERCYRNNEWWSGAAVPDGISRSAQPGDYHRLEDTSHTASYSSREGQVRHITFRPADDLICFMPLKLDQVDWWHHYAGDGVPLVDGDRGVSNGRSFLGLNVAVNYDPMLMQVLKGRTTRNQCPHTWSGESESFLVDMVDLFHENTGRTLWFMDFRLRRREPHQSDLQQQLPVSPAGDAQDRERVVFYTDDCLFVEVKRDDIPDWTVDDDDDGAQETVFDMFDLLHQNYDGRLEIDHSDRMRVLACEVRPGKTVKSWPRPVKNAPCEACLAEQEKRTPFRRVRNTATVLAGDHEIDLEGCSLFD